MAWELQVSLMVRPQSKGPLGTTRIPTSCWRGYRVCGSLGMKPVCTCVPTAGRGLSLASSACLHMCTHACCWNGLYQQLEQVCGFEVSYVQVPAMREIGSRASYQADRASEPSCRGGPPCVHGCTNSRHLSCSVQTADFCLSPAASPSLVFWIHYAKKQWSV